MMTERSSMTKSSPRLYRRSVVGVFVNHHRHLLVLERCDTPDAWQFPQGGIESDETPKQALHREMTEELGNPHIVCLKTTTQTISYNFPASLSHTRIAQRFKGQSALWFLCEFSHGQPDLKKAIDKEFRAFKWIAAHKVVDGTVFWKKQAYTKGLTLLGLI